MKRIAKILAKIAVGFVFYIAALYLIQDYVTFFPDKYYIAPSLAGVPSFEEVPVVMIDGEMVMTWYAKGDENKPTLLFFHGNAGQIATFAPYMQLYIDAGYSILMMEYRGFGKTGGKISEEMMFADAIYVHDYLRNKLHKDRIIFFGYSMGTSVAVGLTQFRTPVGVILEAPFISLYQEVKEKPVPFASWVIKNRLESDKYISKITQPLLIVHGEKDRLIPPHHGRTLFDLAASENKTFKLLEGETHNGLFFNENNHALILEWLGENFGQE